MQGMNGFFDTAWDIILYTPVGLMGQGVRYLSAEVESGIQAAEVEHAQAQAQQAQAQAQAAEAVAQRTAAQSRSSWETIWPLLLFGTFGILIIGGMVGGFLYWRRQRREDVLEAYTTS